jgi:hypothetical protein
MRFRTERRQRRERREPRSPSNVALPSVAAIVRPDLSRARLGRAIEKNGAPGVDAQSPSERWVADCARTQARLCRFGSLFGHENHRHHRTVAATVFCLCLLLAGCPGPKFNPPPSASPSPTPSLPLLRRLLLPRRLPRCRKRSFLIHIKRWLAFLAESKSMPR